SRAGHISMLVQLRTLEVKGLEAIHEDVLREINFEIGRWIREESKDQLEALLDRILSVLGISLQNYPQAALQIIRTMGLEILAADYRPLIDFFLRRIIRLGFQSPMLGQVSSNWQSSSLSTSARSGPRDCSGKSPPTLTRSPAGATSSSTF